MRLQLICTLFMGTVIAVPYGGQEYRKGAQRPTTLTMSGSTPIKGATTTARTPPYPSLDAQKRMLPYEYELLSTILSI
ncbi:hypothetical protein N7471_000025 [Penicillium samsonianum]|uniref:uncharacterized protein n=1 Tax=Penicillium samsonianum TaxID=1882272 RepID=UPI002546C09F|nr:uncharacterized protein N7471_000025 [Penicillium samsonianum]KAJ6148826.1 hypothetical protein N7471_000025 [Penicillium samsonianum]